MAEIRSALYLVALDPVTGQVQWQQQLLGLEQGIALDPAGFMQFDGMRPHQVHLEGGDASSDSYCFA